MTIKQPSLNDLVAQDARLRTAAASAFEPQS